DCGYSIALLRVGSGAKHRHRHRNTGVVIGSPQNSLGRGFSKYWTRVGTGDSGCTTGGFNANRRTQSWHPHVVGGRGRSEARILW
ncbi:unnamed protein product, partial [Pylaiella littoralis]